MEIVKIDYNNYNEFDDMIYWRVNGHERKGISLLDIENIDEITTELQNPNLHIYGVRADKKMVGWISIIYMPKVGKYMGRGHVYVDELWVHDSYRGRGFAVALMGVVEELMQKLKASGTRLYVNSSNDIAKDLYIKCGYDISCEAFLMEKQN